jgi:hypothetical protein
MAGMTDYTATAFLKWLSGQTAMPSLPTHVYLALFTAAPGDASGSAGTEVSGTGYARVAIETLMAVPASSGPTSDQNNATVSFAQAGSDWGTVVAWALFDASTAGNRLAWDYLGDNPWCPFTCTLASPGVINAPGITSGSTPNLANGDSVVVTAEFGGTLATGMSAGTGTVASLSSDTFNIAENTTSVGSGMVRKITPQAIPNGVTASFASGSIKLFAA